MNNYTLQLHDKFSTDLKAIRKEGVNGYKIWELVTNMVQTPFEGLGKPEPLKGDMQGFWSRRIDKKHRLIYKVEESIIWLVSCYGHYDDK